MFLDIWQRGWKIPVKYDGCCHSGESQANRLICARSTPANAWTRPITSVPITRGNFCLSEPRAFAARSPDHFPVARSESRKKPTDIPPGECIKTLPRITLHSGGARKTNEHSRGHSLCNMRNRYAQQNAYFLIPGWEELLLFFLLCPLGKIMMQPIGLLLRSWESSPFNAQALLLTNIMP